VVTVQYDSGLVATLFFAIFGPWATDQETLEIVGDSGRLGWSGTRATSTWSSSTAGPARRSITRTPTAGSSHYGADRELVRKLERFLRGERPPVGVAEGVASLRLVTAAQISLAEGGRPVDPRDLVRCGGRAMINAPLPDRLRPRAARWASRPFYGDIHNHSDLSYGHGSFPDALTKAALQLDFVSVTGHAHWPDMPVDEPSVAHIVDFHVKGFAKLRAAWPGHYEVLRAADRAGAVRGLSRIRDPFLRMATTPSCWRISTDGPLELADDPAGLKAALAARYGDRAFAFPHHIGYRTGARGINWASFDPELSPFVEMFSMHGCAEASETERGYLHSMGPVDGHSTMAHGLAEGTVFGIVGNTDHHGLSGLLRAWPHVAARART
jgi:hypothetical protein